jgi:hypothetical protein
MRNGGCGDNIGFRDSMTRDSLDHDSPSGRADWRRLLEQWVRF